MVETRSVQTDRADLYEIFYVLPGPGQAWLKLFTGIPVKMSYNTEQSLVLYNKNRREILNTFKYLRLELLNNWQFSRQSFNNF